MKNKYIKIVLLVAGLITNNSIVAMTDGEMDKWAFSEEDITDRPTYGDMFNIGYEIDKTEDHPLSKFKSDGYWAREERNKAIYSILEGMSEDEKKKYSFLPDREALRSVSSFPADKVFYDFDKIAVDNGFMTDEEINDIDIKKSSELRMEMAEMQRKGGSNVMAFAGMLASQLNPFNSPENYLFLALGLLAFKVKRSGVH
ncbi:hypothetical protein [uncultured Gammaproteobacteria bacterium]|nr:hypothetical protein [uncultured Gammaproteobacteria bacterium]